LTTYIVLINWTERGIQEVKKSPQRLDAAKKMLKDMGGEIKSVYMTMGEYDLVFVCEASDDAVAARFSLQLGMLGPVYNCVNSLGPRLPYFFALWSHGTLFQARQYNPSAHHHLVCHASHACVRIRLADQTPVIGELFERRA
jgi:uncharacterized protein with GYD domain